MNTAFQTEYTDTEMKKIIKSLVILTDSREQKNSHILEYFDKKKIPYKQKTIKTGDYTAMIPKNEELGIMRDIYLNAAIERKNSVDELVQSIKDRTRFENELIRASKIPFLMIVEDMDGYRKIVMGEYRSQYKAKSVLASLKAFEARYNFTTVFLDPMLTGNYIYYHLLYRAREVLQG
ncbi:ERCC4 domain-containing protein [Cytobacillus sp. IB215665]|uniref:ERCC4 domain-containing protein n=1 Tax=Cytobacillus sp. IB215665 TaxID=3097357 RepID=UPI002A0CECDD|nr:ERCC4 domain-containing protein [Cytobacillus sp. IB215665]MDX8367843.1 ERCC4 domain-containing protein [Cytobacillus sp. IB215665]